MVAAGYHTYTILLTEHTQKQVLQFVLSQSSQRKEKLIFTKKPTKL